MFALLGCLSIQAKTDGLVKFLLKSLCNDCKTSRSFPTLSAYSKGCRDPCVSMPLGEATKCDPRPSTGVGAFCLA